MLSCREVTEKASDYLENTPPYRQRLGIRLHLLLCHHCRRYLRQLRAVTIAFKKCLNPEFMRKLSISRSTTLRPIFHAQKIIRERPESSFPHRRK
ncbi:zf-HC2 domain-containing protein [Nitrosococcus wardiae]|uniref:Zf-HC2 domain-containing protein n=1 Tax=Nitrosococcus wardiae TaxID=1814290 RepID=A0A4P7C113_9GAMM|nr:zf-HC2 domain-containing protein [Nitrosococcus wardiae]